MYVTYEDHETGIKIFDDLGTDRTPIKGETVIVNDDVYKVKKVIHNFQITKIETMSIFKTVVIKKL